MGRLVVNFKCHHTGHCCTEVVCLPTPWDVIRIVRETRQAPEAFLEFITPEEITGVAKNDPAWLRVDGEKYMMALRRHGERCHFLDKKTRFCTIYEHRPILCRLYPFKLMETRDGELKGFCLHSDVGCPRHRDGAVDTKPLYDLYLDDRSHHEDYNALVEVFNRKEYAGKRPEDFVEMFVAVTSARGTRPDRTGPEGG
jgi:Fe-S-cluster containining protein